MSAQEHKEAAAASHESVAIAIVTVSDTRTTETDRSGQTIRALAQEAGHRVVDYRIVKDEPTQVQAALDEFSAGEAQMVIFNGGTGVSRRDQTYDVLARSLEKELPGFGELFRMLSYAEIGSAAMMSRATAGIYRSCAVVSIPGSTNAVKLAMKELILPEIRHLAWEMTR